MKTVSVKPHTRRSPSKPPSYTSTHDWLRVDVAMDAAWREVFAAVAAKELPPDRLPITDQERETY